MVSSLCDSIQYTEKFSSQLVVFFLVASALLTGCGNPGFSSSGANLTSGSSTRPNPVILPSPTVLKSTGIEVVSGAAVNVVGSNGSKVSLSIGEVTKNKTKTANGYQVYLNVSGQNSSQ